MCGSYFLFSVCFFHCAVLTVTVTACCCGCLTMKSLSYGKDDADYNARSKDITPNSHIVSSHNIII